MKLSKNELFIDHSYQRTRIVNAKIRDIALNFSRYLFGSLIIADYGADKPTCQRYAIVDGGGRWEAAKLRNDSDIHHLPCIVYDVDSPEEAAKIFYYLNTSRLNLTSIEKYKSALVFKEPTAVEIDKILTRYHISVEKGHQPMSLESIAACTKAFKSSKSVFEDTMRILSNLCWDHHITQYLFLGTFYMIQHIDGIEDPNTLDRLQKRMYHIGAKELQNSANLSSDRLGRGDRAIAEAMLDRINYKIKDKGDRGFYLKSQKPSN